MTGALLCAAAASHAGTIYVSTNSASDGPGTAWSNAFHSIQGAVDAASSGDTVRVTNGVYDAGGAVTPGYSLTNRVCITNAITLESVNGADVTIIDADGAMRGVYLSTGMLSGFTVTNGITWTSGGSWEYDRSGGGLWLGDGTIASNCVVTGSSAATGGGVFLFNGGTLADSTVSGNTSANEGGGIRCENGGTVSGCTIDQNSCQSGGGGIFLPNASPLIERCEIKGNECTGVGSDGGGIWLSHSAGTVRNCLIVGNVATNCGGGAFFNTEASNAVIESCTIVSNHAEVGGGVRMWGGTLRNCIVYGNTIWGSGDTNWSWGGNSPSIEYTCTTPTNGLPDGEGCMDTDPQFADTDYRLGAASPAIDAGTNQAWMAGAIDLGGNLRIMGTRVDMGCHERIVQHTGVSPTHYVSTSGTSSWPYTNWTTAANNIQDAVDTASDGDTVWVTNGVYSSGGAVTPGHALFNRVCATRPVTLQSVNGPEHTFIMGAEATDGGNGSDAVRCVYMTEGRLDGFTVTNGHTQTSGYEDCNLSGGGIYLFEDNTVVITNCVIAGNSAFSRGGGIYGTYPHHVRRCVIRDNVAGEGGGCYSTGNEEYLFLPLVMNDCMLSGNLAYVGGASWEALLNHCIITKNVALDQCGAGRGRFYYCTITGNLALNKYGGTVGIQHNCIIFGNTAAGKPSNTAADSYDSCSPDFIPGYLGVGYIMENCITNNPQLVSASHIASSSPCRDTGDGYMGCHDYVAGAATGTLYVSIIAEATNVVVGIPVRFEAAVEGHADQNLWSFDDGSVQSNEVILTHAWDTVGDYNVVLRVFNETYPAGVAATTAVSVVTAETSATYAWTDSPNPQWPHDNWSNAAHTLQEAVDAQTVCGGWVWATNGVYDAGTAVLPYEETRNRLAITRNMIVRSVNGPDVTLIKGAAATGGGHGDDAVRGVAMRAGVLSGFTITDGHTTTSKYYRGSLTYTDISGGGITLFGGNGVVSNCTISGNSAYYYGGGSYKGTLNNCRLSGNTALAGGGSHEGTLNNCMITDNTANNLGEYDSFGGGGGGYDTIMNNCTISANTADNGGGVGGYYTIMNNCIIFGNSGGNVSYGTQNSCWTDNPFFVNAGADNYRLQSISPCIDTGNNSYMPSVTDLDGTPRPLDGDNDGTNTVDIGCYEFLNASADSRMGTGGGCSMADTNSAPVEYFKLEVQIP